MLEEIARVVGESGQCIVKQTLLKGILLDDFCIKHQLRYTVNGEDVIFTRVVQQSLFNRNGNFRPGMGPRPKKPIE